MAAAAAGTIWTARPAEAALYYWHDGEPVYDHAVSDHAPRSARRHPGKKDEAREQAAKPQGPLIIAVSIGKQQVKVYDANGFYAQSPVSTGMAGHATPMGVFSVIQKQKWHQSNIYSGAPMPYMQRITWSGVAMHAGVLPGYPASHGCIRMPAAFAIKMYGWTRMGARVIVAPGEMKPESFSNALLPTMRVAPQPAAAQAPQTPAAPKADKGAINMPATDSSTTSEARLELRPTVGHGNTDADAASLPLRGQTHTADASGDLPVHNSATLSDASAAQDSTAHNQVADAAKADASASTPVAQHADSMSAGTSEAQGKAGPDQTDVPAGTETATEKAEQSGELNDKDKPADTSTVPTRAGIPPAATAETATAPPEASKPDAAKSVDSAADGAKTNAAQPSDKPVTDNSAAIPDAKKDQTRLGDALLSIPEIPKGKGQIAVFVSRKDSKLYVRQDFAPLFDLPVTVAASDRPLGTHVFTAEADHSDPNLLHWSVVSLPVSTRSLIRSEDGERGARHHKGGPAEAKPLPVPDSPTEALERITIPPEVMTRIAAAMTTGGSIIVSDQGINQGETGEGTDFIVSLR